MGSNNITAAIRKALAASKITCIACKTPYGWKFEAEQRIEVHTRFGRKLDVILPNEVSQEICEIGNIQQWSLDMSRHPQWRRGCTEGGQIATECASGICLCEMPDGRYAFPIGYWQAQMLMWNYFLEHGFPCPNEIKMPKSVAARELFARADLSPQAIVEFRQVRKQSCGAVREMTRLDAARFFLESFPAGTFPAFRRDLLAWIELHGGLDSMQKKQAHQERLDLLEDLIHAKSSNLLAEIEKIGSLDAFVCVLNG
jgi:hypothetical protein